MCASHLNHFLVPSKHAARQAAVLAARVVLEQLEEALVGIEAARELACAADGGGDSALIIDGKALVHALGPDLRATLLAVSPATYLAVVMHLGCLPSKPTS